VRRISSNRIRYYKRVFPEIYFGFLGFFFVVALIIVATDKTVDLKFALVFLVLPIVLALFGHFIMKRFVFDLVDEVWEDGDALIIKNKDQQERIPLSDIVNVCDTILMNPPRITLTLRYPSRFGKEVTFSPPRKLFSLSRNPVAIELIERIDDARKR